MRAAEGRAGRTEWSLVALSLVAACVIDVGDSVVVGVGVLRAGEASRFSFLLRRVLQSKQVCSSSLDFLAGRSVCNPECPITYLSYCDRRAGTAVRGWNLLSPKSNHHDHHPPAVCKRRLRFRKSKQCWMVLMLLLFRIIATAIAR